MLCQFDLQLPGGQHCRNEYGPVSPFALVESLAESVSMVGVVMTEFMDSHQHGILPDEREICESQGLIYHPKIQRIQSFLPGFTEREGLSVTTGLTHAPQTMTDNQLNEQNTGDPPSGDAQSSETGLTTSSRNAQIAAYCGEVLGVCIFLTESELRELGISLSQTDADVIEYLIDEENGKLAFRHAIGD